MPRQLMGTDEIRYWLRELRTPRYGWSSTALGRTVGVGHKTQRKSTGKQWIYRGEHVKASIQIPRILSGELICVKPPNWRPYNNRVKVQIAANPKPLVPPTQWCYTLKRGLHLKRREWSEPIRVPNERDP